MPGRGKPLAIAGPVVLAGLAVTFAIVFFSRRAPLPGTPPQDTKAAQVRAYLDSADTAATAQDWKSARNALDLAMALDPGNKEIAKRREEVDQDEKRAQHLKEAEAAKVSGDAAAEAAALAEARKIEESEELKRRENEARATDLANKGKAAEAVGNYELAAECYRDSLKRRDDAAVKALLDGAEKKLGDAAAAARTKEAERLAEEAMAASRDYRMTTARERIKAAIALEDRAVWKAELRDIVEPALKTSEDNLTAALKSIEKGDDRTAAEELRRAVFFNKENAEASKLLAQVRTRVVREGMVPVPACRVQVGDQVVQVGQFFLDRTEVTDAEWAEFVKSQGLRPPLYWKEGKPPGDGSGPVMGISAAEADAYAQWRGKRLPTEAEWLAAAGAGDGRAYPWGADWADTNANARSAAPQPVGRFPGGASPCGALDLAGNVAEWTSTVENGKRIAKGGGFLYPSDACANAWRFAAHEDVPLPGHGFRCAVDP